MSKCSPWMSISIWISLATSATAEEPLPEFSVEHRHGRTVVTSHNFQISCSTGTADARQLARTCEERRQQLIAAWRPQGDSRVSVWTPRCIITVHDSRAAYQRALGPEVGSSVGCTTVRGPAGAISERRIDVRADADAWHIDALAHELVHVVLADRFGDAPLPLWADEGMAVLEESLAKRQKREVAAADVEQKHNPVKAADLLYDSSLPASIRHQAFYARSANLVEFLLARRDRATFLAFLEQAQRGGYDAALRDRYTINGVAHLQHLWCTEVALNAITPSSSR